MRFLLDTNILSDLVRQPQGRAASRVARLADGMVGTSIIVAAELRYGVQKKQSPRLTAQVERILSAIPILPFEAPADRIYGEIRVRLEGSGTTIGEHDLLIAAHAIALGCAVVTANEREFTRVEGLEVENWLA